MPLAADVQRERAVEALQRAYLEGRLTVEDLALRTERALGARTTADLRVALRDLPRTNELARRARGAAGLILYFAALAAVWWILSIFLAGVLALLLVTGERSAALLAVPVLWVALTAAMWIGARRRLGRH